MRALGVGRWIVSDTAREATKIGSRKSLIRDRVFISDFHDDSPIRSPWSETDPNIRGIHSGVLPPRFLDE